MSTKSKFRVLLSAAFFVLFLAANAVSQEMEIVDAQVPVIVKNVAAKVKLAPIAGVYGEPIDGTVKANEEKEFRIRVFKGYIEEGNGVSYLRSGRANSGAFISYGNGNIKLNLQSQQYQNAVISLHSLNGKQVFRGNASMSGDGNLSVSNIPVGVYLLSVKGKGSNFFATKLTHSGNRLNINTTFTSDGNSTLRKADDEDDYGRWTITVEAEGYHPEVRTFTPKEGVNPVEEFELIKPAANPKASFKETVNGVSFDMVYIPGGTFTIGCEKSSSECPADASPVSGVKVSNYYIGKAEVTTGLWTAVMGARSCGYSGSSSTPFTSMTWYDAMEFACKLSKLTGRNYRMTTEAEWEYAAKNHLSSLSNISSSSNEEWAYNSWLSTHAGGDDPVGPSSGLYTQKTRRNAQGTRDNITGRLIRSVEGMGPALRLAISADSDYPPGYVSPCYLHMPEMGKEPVNSYRDPRWITGSDASWGPTGAISIGSFNFRVWDDGTAVKITQSYGSGRETATIGQWFTSNNIAFVFVPNSGSITKYAYIFLDNSQASLISDNGFISGFVGRVEKKAASNYAKPTVSGLKSGAELAAAAGKNYKMVDMENIPMSAREQDSRLLDGPNQGWFQDNRRAGGVHHYRKDVDADEFRFTVNQRPSSSTMLANGAWFTVNNTFLRVTHSTGYTAEYLYAVDSDGTFYHNSFMGYERGDFRMFQKTANAPENADIWSTTCGDLCSGEIKKGQGASMYTRMCNGNSTFVPAPCPAAGCE